MCALRMYILPIYLFTVIISLHLDSVSELLKGLVAEYTSGASVCKTKVHLLWVVPQFLDEHVLHSQQMLQQ